MNFVEIQVFVVQIFTDFVSEDDENLEFVFLKPIDGIVVPIDCFCKGQVDFEVVSDKPFFSFRLLVDGAVDGGKVRVAVFHEPVFGFGVALNGLTQGTQLGIAVAHQPFEKLDAFRLKGAAEGHQYFYGVMNHRLQKYVYLKQFFYFCTNIH